MIKVHLKVSKCDQFSQGVDVFVGHTEDNLCPCSCSCLKLHSPER